MVYLIAAIAAIGGFLFGYDTGLIAGALLFIQDTFSSLSTLMKECIVSSMVLGALLGAILSCRLADHFGRRKMLMVTAFLFISGTLITVIAFNSFILILGRLIIGWAIGISSYIVPLFVAEMAETSDRGSLVLLNGIAITGGEVMAFLVDYILIPTHAWRMMFATGLIPAVALFLGMLMVPPSPRWLLQKGWKEKAYATLKKIRKNKNIDLEFSDMLNNINSFNPYWKILFSKKMRPILCIGLFLGILQQFSGVNTVMYYGPFIFKLMGFKGSASATLSTLMVGTVNTLMTIIIVFFVDRLGRRPLLLVGTFIAAFSLFLIAFLVNHSALLIKVHWLMLCLMITYIAGYSMSLGSLFWLIISEIYPLKIRGFAMSFVTAFQWLSNFIVALTFLSLLDLLGISRTFYIYSAMCALAFLFIYFYVPETANLSLEVIEQQWHH